MNHTDKTQTFAILGAVMALALMPLLVDTVYADSADEIASKIQEIEKRLNTIEEKSENFKDSEIGKQAFAFRITGELLSEFQEPSIQKLIKSDVSLKGKLADLQSTYGSTLKKYNQKVSEYERDSSVSLDKKSLINQLKKNQMDYDESKTKVEQKQKTKEFVKSELARLKADTVFQKIHRDIYVANDKDRGIHTDDTLLIALTDVVEKEDFALVAAGMDKMINQYRDAEVRSQLQEYKSLVMDAMKELEEVNNQNTQVLALTSGDVKIPASGEGFGPENEIFNPEIITNQLKQQIKTAVSSTKVLADKISEEHKSQYQAAKTVADKLANNKANPSVTTEETDDSDKPKYQTKGVLNAISKLTKATEKVQSTVDAANQAKAKASDAQSALDAAQSALESVDPDSKEYKNAVKALNKAQNNLNKAQNAADKAQSNAEKAAEQATAAEEKLEAAKEKARQDAKKAADKAAAKAQKAAEAAQKAIDAATKAADKAAAAKQKADDLAQKAIDAAKAAEGADPDSKEAKQAQKIAAQAQKATDAAQKAEATADKKQDTAETKQQQSNDAQSVAAEAAANVC